MFIKLTSSHSKCKIRVNVVQIVSYRAPRIVLEQKYDCKGIVFTTRHDSEISVLETPEQIDQMLTEAYVTIKELK